MAPDVSVVVPVYNAGVNLDGCMRSLLTQTLPADRYEILLVDDGSDDGTGTDIDRWAAQHPAQVRVFHEVHSGWPGRPRNVGIEQARGDYIQFVDSDDALTPGALDRVLRAARASEADIVLPKPASDFRGVNHDLYRANREGLTWRDFPLVESLVPHKLVRRAFVLDHGLRFADRPRHVEDQLFFVHAYAHAQSVAIVADEVCYLFQRRRGFGRNLGDVPADPDGYFRDLEDVLDVIDRHVPDGPERLRFYERFYRVEVLGRLRDRPRLDYETGYRRALFQRIRRLIDERMPPELDALLPAFVAPQAKLVRDHNLPGLIRHAEDLATLTVDARLRSITWHHGLLRIDVDAALLLLGAPLMHEPDARDVADVVVVGRGESATWFVRPTLRLRNDGDGVVVRGAIEIDPRHVLAGGPITPGLWDVRMRVRVGGLTRTVRLFWPEDTCVEQMCLYAAEPESVLPYRTDSAGLALDVGAWSHSRTEHAAAGAVVGDRGWTLPGVVASTAMKLQVGLLLEATDQELAHMVATLRIDESGATLDRSRRIGNGRRVWLRLGDPGSDEPRPLP